MRASDYSTVADIIRTLPQAFGLRNKVAMHFAGKFHQLSQRFNRAKFLVACGFTQEDEE